MTNGPVTEIDIRTQSAQEGLRRLDAAFKAVGASGEAFATELDAQQRQFLVLTARTDEAARARLNFERAERRIGAAFEAGGITAAQYNTALDQQIAKLEAAARRQQGFAASTTGAAGATRNLGQVLGQAGFQVQDFAVQVASGQSAVTALAQQGSQLLGIFGTGGAIAGAALAIGAIAFKLLDWKSAAERAAEASDKLDEAIKSATETMDRQVRLGRDLVEQQGRELDRTADLARYYASLTGTMREYETTRLRIQRAELVEKRDQARASVDAALAGLGPVERAAAAAARQNEIRGGLGAAPLEGPAGAAGELTAALRDFRAEGDSSSEALARLYLRLQGVRDAGGDFADRLKDITAALDAPIAQAIRYEEQLKKLDESARVAALSPAEQERLAADTTKSRDATQRAAEKEAADAARARESAARQAAREAADIERERQRAAREAEREAQRALEVQQRQLAAAEKAEADALERLQKRQAAFDEWLAALEREAELAGETKEIREAELRLIEARKQAGRDLTADEEMRVRRAVETKQAFEAQRKAAKETSDFISNSFDRAFDRIGDAAAAMALDGKDAFASLANVGRAVAASLYSDFIKLTLVNPLRNAIFGSGAPTLGGGFFDLFGGGGGAGAGAGNTLATVGGAGFTGGTFATGGDHPGGLRMVGERGREIEATGPARIWSAEQTRDFLQGGRGRVVINDNRAAGSPDLSITENGNGDIIVTIDERIRRATPSIVEQSTVAVGARMRRGAFP